MFLVLTEEPAINAFARYEEDLGRKGRQHSVEHLQYWLANEAVSRVDFWRKWVQVESPNVLVARVEDLVSAPYETLQKIFSAAGVDAGEREIDAAMRAAAEHPASADVKGLEANPRFARPCFVEYMNLLAQEANYLGYPAWQDLKAPSGPVTTIYCAQRALDDKNYEEVVSLLAPFVGMNAVDKAVRAMLGRALLEVGREIEGRRALEIVLRVEPDYLDGYTLLAEHAYELGLTFEARGYLREAAQRPGGRAHVGAFLQRLKIDPELAREFPGVAQQSLPVERQSVIGGFRWILGRLPESEDVIIDHRRLRDDDTLRMALLRSQEFMEFFERFDAGQLPSVVEEAEPVGREDIILALRWILGRSLRSRAEADELLDSKSRDELRLRLVGAEEFRQSYRHAA
jgi:tetratricopeptide (TPR) repeat protein